MMSLQTYGAVCSVKNVASITVPISTTLTLPKNKTIGSNIGSSIALGSSPNAQIECSGSPIYAVLKLSSDMVASSIGSVYETGIPGIGIKVWESSGHGNISPVKPEPQKWYQISNGWQGPAFLYGLNLQLYVTGPIKPGLYAEKIIVETWASRFTNSISGADRYVIVKLPGITVKALSCETPDIKVDLEKHRASEFSGINSTSTAKQFNFEIKNCSPGLNSVNYTFKPAAGITLENSGATNQYLTLTSDSDATGVGVQVLYDNNTNVLFNSKINYNKYKTAIGGNYIIPMKARYIQTASTITGGKANSALEFTMSYE